MIDMEEMSENKEDYKRKSRNLSEKKRRDQFNILVTELGNLVMSWGSSSSQNRKMDKTTVLKSTISFLKKHKHEEQLQAQQRQQQQRLQKRRNDFFSVNEEDWKPSFLSHEEFTQLMLEAVRGFILVFGTDGKIIYASETIASLLGYVPLQITDRSVYELVDNDEDKLLLFNMLVRPVNDRQIEIFVRLKRANANERELVRMSGRFFSWSDSMKAFVSAVRFQNAPFFQENTTTFSHNRFFGTESEFTSRYSLEWKFLFLDGRAPPIIGYLPFELLGTSGYDYYHSEDLERVSICHESLMQTGGGISCVHRFLTKGQQWIWLQTRYYITYHQWNSKPEFIVATHRVVNYSEIFNQFHKKDSNMVGEKAPSHIEESCSPSISSSFFGSTGARSTIEASPKKSEEAAVLFVSPLPVSSLGGLRQADRKPEELSNALQSDNVNLTQSQLELQEQLRVKHNELSQKIVRQQEELRHISEQLLMSQYGLLPLDTLSKEQEHSFAPSFSGNDPALQGNEEDEDEKYNNANLLHDVEDNFTPIIGGFVEENNSNSVDNDR